MVHAGYVGYWWELYRAVTSAPPTRTWLMDDDLGDLVRVSEQIAGSAENVGINSTPLVKFLLQAEDCYYGTGSTPPVADPALELWLVRVRVALAERERTNFTTPQPSAPQPVSAPTPTQEPAPTPTPTQQSAPVPTPASPPVPEPPLPTPRPFEFEDFDKQPVVNGNVKPHLTQAEHDILTALLEAGERGLTKDELDERSGRTDSRKYLRKLARDADWASVIVFPEGKGRGGYRLRTS